MPNTWARLRSGNRLKQGISRLRSNWLYVIQAGMAAGLAYLMGKVLGHDQPFFAPMAAVIVLSTTGGERFRRSIELVIGVSLGVGLGDLLIATVGTGPWQIAVAVMASIALATVIDKGVLLANQAAFAAVLVATILPPGTSGGTNRMVDAFIGGMVGLAVMAIVPESPLRSGRREIAKILGITAQVLTQVERAAAEADADAIAEALREARGTQGQINSMIAAANSGKENLNVSPLLWTQRHRIRSLIRVLNPVDNAIRNTRVLARHARHLAEIHHTPSGEQLLLLQRIAAVAGRLSDLYFGKGSESAEIPVLSRELKEIGARAGREVAVDQALPAQVMLGQTRALIVDLLQICGLSRDSAMEALAPIGTVEKYGQANVANDSVSEGNR
ncbi:FUSC family protein [Corynebacterium gerontici]|uniref:Integral membrane bound transporter domain-containing protein n=1 Tax=Corynebacterium gerontici TaxID=2079234 RepID=A0A3G6IY75_9CORY|nr:FUSC family protein [Corynebacterium gerontici]AZA10607.1 hypothetical protein CGERO_01365 [Corynebacterium gerontici]